MCGFLWTFSQCFTFFTSFVTMSSWAASGAHRVNRWTRNSAQRIDNYFYEALVMWSQFCHGHHGGTRKTLNSSPGWWRSSANLPLSIVLCSFVRLINSSPHALHTQGWKMTTEKPSVHVVKQHTTARSVQPTRTCTATTTASLKHQGLRLLRE